MFWDDNRTGLWSLDLGEQSRESSIFPAGLLQNLSVPTDLTDLASAGPFGATKIVTDSVFTNDHSVILVGETWAAFPEWGAPFGGATDGFLVKLGLDGNVEGALQFDTPSYDEVASVAVGADGSIFVVGTASLSGDMLTGGSFAKSGDKGFIAKLSSDLSQQWIRQQTIDGDWGFDDVEYKAVAVDHADGSAVVVGRVWGALPGTTYQFSGDASIQKYDASGELLWSQTLASPMQSAWSGGIDQFSAVAVDDYGSIFAAGTTNSSLPGESSNGDYDIILANYSAFGALQWSRQFGTNKSDYLEDLVVDSDGSAYVLAWSSQGWSSADFLSAPLEAPTSSAQTGLFKFDSSGDLLWYDLIASGSTSGVYGSALYVGPDGNVYVAGQAYTAFNDFYGGSGDLFLAHYSSTGERLSLISHGDAGSQSVAGIQVLGDQIQLAGSASSIDGRDLDPTSQLSNLYYAQYSVAQPSLPSNPLVSLNYGLTRQGLDGTPIPLTQLATLGQSVQAAERYDLVITAQSLRQGWSLDSADITLHFDSRLFNDIQASDITIGGEMPLANAVLIDNAAGTIRLAASSLSNLGQGAGITADTVLAKIGLDFDEAFLVNQSQNTDGSFKGNPLFFSLEANLDETVLSRIFDDGTGYENREIATLAELGGDVASAGVPVTLYEARINLEQQGDGMVLGTQRVIGADAGFTNLVRTGDVISVSSNWLNVGNIQAANITAIATPGVNAQMIDFSVTSSTLNSGSFVSGVFQQDGRESTDIEAKIRITGSAGQVADLGQGVMMIQADGSNLFSNAGKGSKNLITYQGDLNYDGRVSMKDLAYLNAGAARQVLDNTTGKATAESYARDVDADFSGKIDLADLAVLDADWGKSLHTGDQDFLGSGDLSWSELDLQGVPGETGLSWNNGSFKEQNAVEAAADYVGSLENPVAVGVIGADGDSSMANSDITGTYFQDFVAA